MSWNELYHMLTDEERQTDVTVLTADGEIFRAVEVQRADSEDDVLDIGHPYVVLEIGD